MGITIRHVHSAFYIDIILDPRGRNTGFAKIYLWNHVVRIALTYLDPQVEEVDSLVDAIVGFKGDEDGPAFKQDSEELSVADRYKKARKEIELLVRIALSLLDTQYSQHTRSIGITVEIAHEMVMTTLCCESSKPRKHSRVPVIHNTID